MKARRSNPHTDKMSRAERLSHWASGMVLTAGAVLAAVIER